MKKRIVRILAVVFFSLSFTACTTSSLTPETQEEVITTMTTNTSATITTTTTTADTTTTTTTTEQPTESTTKITVTESTATETSTTKKHTTTTEKSTKSTTSKTTEKTTKTTTANPYAPYEDNNLAPEKNKRCLVLNVMGEQVEMVFEKALVCPADYNRLIWVYTGTTQNGSPYTCEVVAEQERISKITCEATPDSGKFTEEDGIAAVREFFNQSRVDISVRIAKSRIQYDKNGQPFYNCVGSFGLVLGDDYNKCTGRIEYKNGRPYVSWVKAQTWSGAWIPGYSGDDIPLLIPRWKSK